MNGPEKYLTPEKMNEVRQRNRSLRRQFLKYKQVAKVLLFLQEHDCRDYETLVKKAEETSARFSDLSA